MRLNPSGFFLIGLVLAIGCGDGTENSGGSGGGSGGMGGTAGDDTPPTPSPSDLVPELLTAGEIRSIWGTSRNDLFIAGRSELLAHYDGSTWRPFDVRPQLEGANADELEALYGFASNDVYAAGERGVILHFDGSTWTLQDDEEIQRSQYSDIWGSRPNDVYVVGDSGTVMHFDGGDWTEVDTGISFFGGWQGVHGIADDDILLVGFGGLNRAVPRAAHFNGASWSEVTVPEKMANGGPRLNTVWMLSSTLGFAGGSPGWMLQWNGSTLTEVASGTTEAIRNLWGIANQAFAVAVRNNIQQYDGAGWGDAPGVAISDDIDPVADVFGFAGNDVVAAGSGVFRYNGAEWAELFPSINRLRGFWASGSNNILLLGSRVLRVTEQGVAPENFGGLTVPELTAAWGPDDNIIAVGTDGSAFRFNGTGWGAMNTSNEERLLDIWGASDDNVFAVGDNGTILNFNGAAWGAMASGTSETLRKVWGRSASEVYAVGDQGTIVRYDGSTWSPMVSGVTDTLRDVIGFGDTDVWVAYAGGFLVWDGVAWTPTPVEYEGVLRGVSTIAATDENNIYMSLFAPEVGLRSVSVHYDGETFTELPVISGASSLLAVGPLDVLAGDSSQTYRFQVP